MMEFRVRSYSRPMTSALLAITGDTQNMPEKETSKKKDSEKSEKQIDAQNNENSQIKVQFHVPQELEYTYRDIFNVYVGTGDVVIEMGNLHRSMPEHASISNRVVLSIENAYKLNEALQKGLQAAQLEMRKRMQAGMG